jgi:glycosyltransferase involved in cell wall biosynthesis
MPGDQKTIKAAISVINCICYDQRVLKIAEIVKGLNTKVTIIGRVTAGCTDPEIKPYRTVRFRMLFKRKFLFYGFFNIRLFIHLLFHRYDLLVSNDLDTLLPNYLISRLKHLPLVYDSHEYFTGVPEIQNKPFVKWVWLTIERSIFRHLKYTMTVSDSISDQYFKEYGIRPLVVRNCSRAVNHLVPLSRKEIGVPDNHLFLIYQGAGINVDRGAEELIDALEKTERVFLLIAGSGDVLPALVKKVSQLRIENRIMFLPKMDWEELMRYTKSADAGLTLDKKSNTNYEFSLPNKLFDYISAGLPVIASDLNEIGKIVTEYRIGILIPEVTPDEVSQAICQLRDKPQLLSELKGNAQDASKKINWENEKIKVLQLYQEVFKENSI